MAMRGGPRGSLRHRCALLGCTKAGPKLLLCSGCRAVRYCIRDHQVAHRPQHKTKCSQVKRLRSDLSKEEGFVRNAAPQWGLPANAFETSVGRFWATTCQHMPGPRQKSSDS